MLKVADIHWDLFQAEALYQRALAGCEEALGPDHMSTLDTISNLGISYRESKKWEKSIDCFERALAVYKAVKGEVDPETVDAQSQIALTRQLADDEYKSSELSRLDRGSCDQSDGSESYDGPSSGSESSNDGAILGLYSDSSSPECLYSFSTRYISRRKVTGR